MEIIILILYNDINFERGRKKVLKTDVRRNVEKKIDRPEKDIVLDLDYAYMRGVAARVLSAL